VFAGGVVGVLIDAVRTSFEESKLNLALFAGGVVLAAGAYASSWFPSPYAHSQFWGSSPAFFLIRTGIMVLMVPIAYAWEMRGRFLTGRDSSTTGDTSAARWSPLQQFGRSSLFVYWIHVEMVYGLISLRIHKGLSHPAAWAAFAAFTLFMLACVVAKDRFLTWRGGRRRTAPPAPLYATQ
jgi:hypothetical protein